MILPDVQQLRAWDKATLEEQQISSLQLMERAAIQCTDWIAERYLPQQKICVVCRKGNNGGDGVAIARLLYQQGYPVEVYMADWDEKRSKDFEANLDRLQQTDVNITFLKTEKDFSVINNDSLIVEALFGFGLNRKLEGLYELLIRYINESNTKVISIDVPAGLFTDTSSKGNTIINATATLTFETLKLCFLMPENASYFGEVYVLPIGLSKAFGQTVQTKYYLTDLSLASSLYQPRKKFSHKGTYGHALLVAGNEGKMGAAVMCVASCLRSGVGLLTCSVPPNDFPILHTALPEAMVTERDEEMDVSPYAVIGIGPGLGKEKDTANLLHALLKHFKKPIVIDADALNLLSENREWFSEVPESSVLTPHPKEFERLFGETESDFAKAEKAIAAAKQYKVVIVLKGTYTLVTDGEKNYFNSSGNNGMATGGSGDILTGLITGLIAQKYEPFEAAVVGVYVHGLAADLCLEDQSYESLLPMDVVGKFGAAFKQLQNNKGA